jgi:hypothetical protein
VPTLPRVWAIILCGVPLWAGFSEAEQALRKAVAAKDANGVIAASTELLALQTPEAVKAVIRFGLVCDNYKAEKAIVAGLAKLPVALRTPVHEAARGNELPAVRVILAAVLAAYDDPASFQALGGLVKDLVPAVALAATKQLGTRALANGEMRAVDCFIEGLARHEKSEQSAVVAADIRLALNALTGEELETAADWKKWWEPRRGTFKPEDAKRNADRPRRTVVRQRSFFFSHEIVSKRVLFILDMSGSMTKKDLPVEKDDDGKGKEIVKGRSVVREKQKEKTVEEKEKEKKDLERKAQNLPIERQRLHRVQVELKRTIDSLTPDTRFTVMAFNQEIKLLAEAPQYATVAFKQKAKDFVDAFKPNGETWTDTAMDKAFGLKDQIDTIYLLSDGQPQRKGKFLDRQAIRESVKERNRFLKIKLYTVGFAQCGSAVREFLGGLASDSGATYKELE